ncbi:MAG: hypothetical protein AB8B80_09035 [Marinicellaceae bacterium]
MSNLEKNYAKILEALHQVKPQNNFLIQIRTPKLSGIELIALNITSEYMGVDSERDLFRRLQKSLLCRKTTKLSIKNCLNLIKLKR